MSVHPTLRSGKSKKQSSVLKRLERVLRLKKEDRWTEEDSVFGIPKVKVTKLKIKKEKAKAAEAGEEAAAEGAEVNAAPGAETKDAGEKKPQDKKAGKK